MSTFSVSAGALLAVRTPVQFARFLHDSQVRTGRAERQFVICGADRLRYQVAWSIEGCRIERLDATGGIAHTVTVPMEGFFRHPLVDALRCGQLFTPSHGH